MSNSFPYKEFFVWLGGIWTSHIIKVVGVFLFRPHPKPLPI